MGRRPRQTNLNVPISVVGGRRHTHARTILDASPGTSSTSSSRVRRRQRFAAKLSTARSTFPYPSRVHRARGWDGKGRNAKPCSEQAIRSCSQVSTSPKIGLITRASSAPCSSVRPRLDRVVDTGMTGVRKLKGGAGDACPTTLAALYVPFSLGLLSGRYRSGSGDRGACGLKRRPVPGSRQSAQDRVRWRPGGACRDLE